MDIEFEIGQEITFKPYEKECKCVIKDILTGQKYLNGEPDPRPRYRISGDATSYTNPESIMESKYFIPWEDHPDYTNIQQYDPNY